MRIREISSHLSSPPMEVRRVRERTPSPEGRAVHERVPNPRTLPTEKERSRRRKQDLYDHREVFLLEREERESPPVSKDFGAFSYAGEKRTSHDDGDISISKRACEIQAHILPLEEHSEQPSTLPSVDEELSGIFSALSIPQADEEEPPKSFSSVQNISNQVQAVVGRLSCPLPVRPHRVPLQEDKLHLLRH